MWPGIVTLRYLLSGVLGLLAAVSPAGLDAKDSLLAESEGRRACLKVILRGEVAVHKEWQEEVGKGWVFRVLPIVNPSLRSSKMSDNQIASGTSPALSYTGWDLVMDRAVGGGYPDALLLATPPYGSVNEREIGTTFGLRAQDAIAWEPRKFQFFTQEEQVQRARVLYSEIFAGAQEGFGGEHSGKAASDNSAKASIEMLHLISGNPEMGHGQFSITNARLVVGSGDPPTYASGWLAHLSQVPHTLEQASSQGFQPESANSNDRGELRSIQFVATLWFPGTWKVRTGIHSETANCAE